MILQKKYHISEKNLSLFGKHYGIPIQKVRAHYNSQQTKKLLQHYGRNKYWLQRRTRQEAAFDFGISERQFKYIKQLYTEQQEKAAQMPSGTHTKKAHQPAKPQAKAAHTAAHTQTGSALPKDLERLPLGSFLSLYDPKAHIPVPPDPRRPARAQPQRPQRVTKRTHGAGAHMQTGSALPKELERVPWGHSLHLYDPKSHIPLPPHQKRPARAQPQQRGFKRPHGAGQHMQPNQPTPSKRRRLNP